MALTDTQRLDAMEAGLFLSSQERLVEGVWVIEWVCCIGTFTVIAPTMREAIDAAVDGRTKH